MHMKSLLRNPYFLGYSALYFVILIMMALTEHFPVSQAIAVLLIIGVLFTLVAYITSKSSVALFENKQVQKGELLVIISIAVYITLILTFGLNPIKLFFSHLFTDSAWPGEIITISYKLLMFVLLPFLVYKCIYKFNLRDFGLAVKANEFFTVKNSVILLAMAFILLLFQFFIGNGAKPIRDGLITNR